MVNLVGTVVKRLECLCVEEAHQKIECRIIIWYDSVQSALLFPQGVEVHIVVICDSLNLRQIEGCQPDSGGH